MNCNLINFTLEDNSPTMNINLGDAGLPGGTDYDSLRNKPSINNILLQGNKSLDDLGIVNDKTYYFIQNIPSNEWVITHNLKKYPAVTVLDSAASEVIGEVDYIDTNTLKIKFKGEFSGSATLN